MPDFDFSAFRAGQAADNAAALKTSGIKESTSAVAKAAKPTAAAPASGKAKAPKPRKKAAPKRKADEPPPEPRIGTRRSARGSTQATSAKDQEERRRILEEAEARKSEEEAAFKAEQNRRKHGDRELEAETGVTGSGDTESFRDMLKEIAESSLDDEDGWEKGKRPEIDAEKLEEETKELELRGIVKVIPDRIYSMVVHPDTQRDLVFTGDKTGHISIWDSTNAGKSIHPEKNGSIRDAKPDGGDEDEEGDEEETEEQQWGKWWVWKGHLANSVSCLKFRPGDGKQLFSSAYDGTLRSHHFERGISEEIIDGDRWTDEGLIHSFDFDPTGNELWASDNNGGLMVRDLREPKEKAKRWDIDGYKVGCVSINPANSSMAATSHLKRYMRLWDLSAIRGLPEDADTDDLLEKACLAEFPHEKACTSAYFDATGTRLASTSYDDAVRIWDIDPQKLSDYPEGLKWKPANRFTHNCQVGAYVTVIRAKWSTVPALPPHLHVGDMSRVLDLYSPDGARVKTFTSEAITAVPAVSASHPTLAGRYYGGAASGKVSFWTTPLEDNE
ncbi:hypothetical protein JCM11641_000252 [Rhodosporidiobolus odoratus]